jgi:drug/metabolite transporter (DMT)-like permease
MTPPYAHGNPRIAAALALGAACVLPVSDAMMKALVVDYPVVMVAWARMALIVVFLGAVGGAQVGLKLLRPVAWRLQLLRGFSAVLGTTFVVLGFRVMPLAECIAIISVAPVLANLFSRWWLNEPGNAFSWIAALASFIGVLIIVRPGTGIFALAAVYPMIATLGLASFLAITRAVSGRDDPRVTAFFGPLVAFLALSLAMPLNWVTPKTLFDIALFLGIGVLSASAQVLTVRAYRHGTTHQVAPFSYLSLVVAIGVGWLAFGAVPDGWSMTGMAIIGLVGIVTVLRR